MTRRLEKRYASPLVTLCVIGCNASNQAGGADEHYRLGLVAAAERRSADALEEFYRVCHDVHTGSMFPLTEQNGTTPVAQQILSVATGGPGRPARRTPLTHSACDGLAD